MGWQDSPNRKNPVLSPTYGNMRQNPHCPDAPPPTVHHHEPHSKNLFFDGETFTGPALDALLAGYKDVLPLSAAERAAFPPLTQTCTVLYRAFLWKTGK